MSRVDPMNAPILQTLAGCRRRVALEQVMVPLCEQTQELIREVLEMMRERKERS